MSAGTFHDLGALEIPGFGPRPVQVYLPARAQVHQRPGPALYMLDGQNVFGDEGSFAGGWHAHQAVEKLSPRTSHVPIIVSIGNGAELRLEEMTAWADRGMGGRAAAFVGWIADVLVPRIVRDFNVQPGPVGAAMCGSSMGGLASLYAHHLRPDVFGGALCMSSSFFWARRQIFDLVARSPVPPLSRIYLDCGAREGGGRMVGVTQEMAALLAARGYGPDRLVVRTDARGVHNERAWRRRLPRALRFLYRR